MKKQAIQGNKEAQFLLGFIYEKKDLNISNYWYKKASSQFNYIVDEVEANQTDNNQSNSDSLIEKIKNSTKESSKKRGAYFNLSRINIDSPEVKSRILNIIENKFGLYPYQENFLAPFSFSSINYTRHFSAYSDSTIPAEWQPYIEYQNRLEAEFQLSFHKPLTYNLFGLNEFLHFGYTQKVWWKIYDKSAPFRETNYFPEIFMTLPTSDYINQKYNLRLLKFGYRHQSNGQEGYHSRSWDRLFFATLWQFDNLFFKLETWYRIPEEKKGEDFYNGTNPKDNGDDNPDILNYMGYGDIKLKYIYRENEFNLLLRNNLNFKENKGAVKFSYTSPLVTSKDTFWYLKIFSGYGESMIDYNQKITKVTVGFAYSRGSF